MQVDETEGIRKVMQAELNEAQASRESLEKQYGKVWSTEELREEFEVIAFLAPFVSARRKSDSRKGLLMFQHSPRFYFAWEES